MRLRDSHNCGTVVGARVGERGLTCGGCRHLGIVQMRDFIALLLVLLRAAVMVEAVVSDLHWERNEGLPRRHSSRKTEGEFLLSLSGSASA